MEIKCRIWRNKLKNWPSLEIYVFCEYNITNNRTEVRSPKRILNEQKYLEHLIQVSGLIIFQTGENIKFVYSPFGSIMI